MKGKNKRTGKKYFEFIDIVIDVFYSIILYNIFTMFPGIENIPGLILFCFLIIAVLDYWWSERTIEQIPKYRLSDLYFYTFIFFVFSQIGNYLNNSRMFILWFISFMVLDLIFCIVDKYVYKKEKEGQKFLDGFIKVYVILLAIYAIEAYFITTLNIVTAIIIAAPYAVNIIFSISRKKTELEAVYISD